MRYFHQSCHFAVSRIVAVAQILEFLTTATNFPSLQKAPSLLALKMKMANTLLSVVMAQYYVWPVAQFLSFRYCPAVLRVLYCDAVGVFWNCFLCASLAA